MRTIGCLIVEDHEESRKVIALGINDFNESQKDFVAKVTGEAVSYEDAVPFLTCQDKQLEIVFLDIGLATAIEGWKLCRDWPQIAYIVVSKDPTVSIDISRNTDAHPYHYLEKAADGSFDSGDIMSAIQKYIRIKRVRPYEDYFKIGNKYLSSNEVAFISKRPLRVTIDRRGHQSLVPFNDEAARDERSPNSIYVYSNQVDKSKRNGCLQELYFSRDGGKSLSRFLERYGLDPHTFLRISGAVIVNLRFSKKRLSNKLYIELRDRTLAILRISGVYAVPETYKSIDDVGRSEM